MPNDVWQFKTAVIRDFSLKLKPVIGGLDLSYLPKNMPNRHESMPRRMRMM